MQKTIKPLAIALIFIPLLLGSMVYVAVYADTTSRIIPFTNTISNTLPKIKDVTCSNATTMYILVPSLNNQNTTVYKLADQSLEQIITGLSIDDHFIHAPTQTFLLMLTNTLFRWQQLNKEGYAKEQRYNIKNSDFHLSPDDIFIAVGGNNLKKLWITYKKADGNIKSRFFALEDGRYFESYKNDHNYKSITIGHDNSLWLLNSSKKEIDRTEVDDIIINNDQSDILTNESDILTFKAPINTIYAHDKNTLYGLDANGYVYQWDKGKEDFSRIVTTGAPQGNYIKITSAKDGPTYILNKNGKIYNIVTSQQQIKVEKEKEQLKQEKSEEIKDNFYSVEDESTSEDKPQKKLSTIELKKRTNPAEAQLAKMLLARKQPGTTSIHTETTPASFFTPMQTEPKTQKTISPTEWRSINEQRKDINFESGFNAGFVQGVRENEHYQQIEYELQRIWEQGIKSGARGCILDTVLWHIIDILKQEGFKALQEQIKLF